MGFVDPFTLTLWRFVLGLLFLVLVPGSAKRFKEIKALSLKSVAALAFLGFLNVFFSMSMLQLAVKFSSAATAATIFCSNPLFVFLIALGFKSEKFSKLKIAGLFVGIAGIFLIMNEKGLVFKSGLLFAVAGAVAFSVYTVLSKKMVSGITPITVNLVSFFFGILISLSFIFIAGIDLLPQKQLMSSSTHIFAIIYLGFVVSGVGYITFFNAIKRYSAVSASLIFMLKPAVATVFAFLFLNEDLPEIFFLGLLMIMLGTFMVIWTRLKKVST